MKLKGKGWNPEAFIECVFCLIFGILLFGLTYSGHYLSFVTPRMKPYLYGLSALMILWAVMNARNILKPRYKNRMYHCLVLVIPILILADPPAPPDGSGLIRKYETISLPGAPSSNRTPGAAGSVSSTPGGPGSSDPGGHGSSAPSGQDTGNQGAAGSVSQTQGSQSEQTEPQSADSASGNPGQSAVSASGNPGGGGDDSAWYTLTGLDEKAKTITVSDDDFYTWMFEFGVNGKKYDGYTITMKGFIYREPDSMKKNEFALVRLSMWCCAADLTPIGLLVENEGLGTKFKENDWVTVTGKAEYTSSGDLVLKAKHIETAEKPEEEYVYPTF